MKVFVFQLYQKGVRLPAHRIVARGGMAGRVVLETVRHKALDRPTQRLRFIADDPSISIPDLLDVELRDIVENEFLFGGIEGSSTNAVQVQYLAQVWRVTVPGE